MQVTFSTTPSKCRDHVTDINVPRCFPSIVEIGAGAVIVSKSPEGGYQLYNQQSMTHYDTTLLLLVNGPQVVEFTRFVR